MQCVRFKDCFVNVFLYLFSTCALASPLNLKTSINIETIDGYGFKLRDVAIKFDSLFAKNTSYRIQVDSANLPDNRSNIKNIILMCYSGIISKKEISCDDGELSFNDLLVSAEKSKFRFYRKENGNMKLSLDKFELAEGSAILEAQMNKEGWQIKLVSDDVSLIKIRELLPTFPQLFSSGSVKSNINFMGSKDSLIAIQGNGVINDLSFTNDESTAVSEGVSTKFKFASKRHKDKWETNLDSTTFKGELYFDPVFIDANTSAKDLFGKINWQIGSKQIELSKFQYEDPSSLHIEVNTVVDLAEKEIVKPVQAKINYALFPNVYKAYLQPFLFDTNAADLTSNGKLSGEVVIEDYNVTQANLDLGYLSLIDNQNRFSLINLNGSLGWGESYVDKNYTFNFELADLYKLRLGASEFSFINQEHALVLSRAVNVPLLDGSINIESFQVNHPGKQDQSAVMDISLTPVSMSKLSTSLGWTEMNGNLAGYAPNVIYKKGDIEIGGALLLRGFGGNTTIHNLNAKDIFSITPKLSADIQLNNLDLTSLTETFSFGEISGKLSGTISDLQFVSWAPVKFDAWLGTPENDNSRHRISQTAVDNLTQVGNGASNVLSKSFLKFFDSFGYDKLGLGCRLRNNICKMRGVSDVETGGANGFYIVKGSGVPRIDIVGYTDEVSWSVLTARLKRVVSTKEIIVN